MNSKHIAACTLGVIIAFAMSGNAWADTVYSDTFSRVTGSGDGNGDPNGAADNFSDWGTNDNGLGGSVSQAWVAGPSRAGGGRNAVTDGALGLNHGTTSFFDFDVTNLAPHGFTVALDFRRYPTDPTNPPGPNGYIAFGLGVDAGTAITNDFHAIGNSDFAVSFQQANAGNAANAEVFEDNVLDDVFDYLTPDAAHSLFLTVIPAVSGAYGAADSVSINVLVDGSISNNYTVLGGANFGSFAVSANNFEARYIDNLIVTAIPEPASVGLLGFALAGLLTFRRRVK